MRYLKKKEGGKQKMRDSKIQEKQPVVNEISGLLKDAKSAVVVDYRGLTVEQDTRLRKELRDAGVSYKVFKNTMIRIAAKGTEFEKLDEFLNGPTAIAISGEDSTAAARIVSKFAKKANSKSLQMKGGMIDGILYDAAGISAVADIPSKEELLGRLFGSWKSPVTNFARVLKQIAEKKDEGTAADAAPAEDTTAAAPEAEAVPAAEPSAAPVTAE